MFGDNSSNGTNQQPAGDNTPPPMLDTPISNDPPASVTPLTSLPEPSDPQASDDQFAPSQPQQDWMASPSEPTDTSASATSSDHADDKHDDFMDEPPANTPSTDNGGSDDSNGLLDIKQQALQQLTPLVDHLDQTPKEEFRTTMMMIQATDNQELIKKAFAAAQKIDDDKERAQAFLDIINEINYFTQHHQE
ncbi:MAG TPA: hypothetical protein VFB59_01185 [Candidatus Saccharimonadales bacterium]|nr:hypothetical protein [Candidatus Saccharimonadales bacterium]